MKVRITYADDQDAIVDMFEDKSALMHDLALAMSTGDGVRCSCDGNDIIINPRYIAAISFPEDHEVSK